MTRLSPRPLLLAPLLACACASAAREIRPATSEDSPGVVSASMAVAAAPRSEAESLLADALARAAGEAKRVFLVFGAPG